MTSPKVKDGTLLSKDFKAGQLPAGPRGPEGPTGPAGTPGAAGQTGARGPSNAYTDFTATQIQIAPSPGTVAASIAVPAGNWVVFGRVNVFNNGVLATGDCSLFSGGAKIDAGLFKLSPTSGVNELPLSLQAPTTVAGPTVIQMTCEEESNPGVDFRISERRLTAIQVETLVQQ